MDQTAMINNPTKPLPKSRRAALRKALIGSLALLFIAATASAQPLDRNWQFLADMAGTFKASDVAGAQGWRNVRVGLSWNAQFEDLRDYMGVAWYRTSLNVPQLDKG